MTHRLVLSEDFHHYTNDDLRQFYCNAKATYCLCLGHGKTARNKEAYEHYAYELTARDADVPTDEEVEKYGQFNGQGSW